MNKIKNVDKKKKKKKKKKIDPAQTDNDLQYFC